jgi:hypothetical protein
MKVKITKKGGYRCAPEGHTVVAFAEGAEVEGTAAEMAMADKAGEEVKGSMAKKSSGSAPENK